MRTVTGNVRLLTGAMVVALALGGCVGSLIGTGLSAVAVNRYDDHGRKGTAWAYDDCAVQDNTSWTVLDACMLRKGYTVKP